MDLQKELIGLITRTDTQKVMQLAFLDAPIRTEPSIEIYVDVMKRLTPVIKPVGNACNSRCVYCFYSGRHPSTFTVMDDILREEVIRKFLSWDADRVDFIWHGGEPLLAGTEFYQKAIKEQEKHNLLNKSISNSFQTNGTLLDDEWVSFCIDNNFDIGLSFDGTPELHDKQRPMIGEVSSYKIIDKAFDLMQEKGLKINVICVVTKQSLSKWKEIIDFCIQRGINSIDFSPCNDAFNQHDSDSIEITMKEFSEFIIHIFEYWVDNSDPSFRIRTIDNVITGIFNKEPLLCHMRAGTSCGLFATINNDGNIYICDNLDSESDRLIDNIKNVVSYDQILHNDTLTSYQNEFTATRRNLNCDSCSIQHVCSAGCPKYAHLITPDRCKELILFIDQMKDRVLTIVNEEKLD